jgi:hypothetical protein
MYMNLYGTLRSFVYNERRVGIVKLIFLSILTLAIQPVKYIFEIIAILWGLVTPKNEVVIVDKNVQQNELENILSLDPC